MNDIAEELKKWITEVPELDMTLVKRARKEILDLRQILQHNDANRYEAEKLVRTVALVDAAKVCKAEADGWAEHTSRESVWVKACEGCVEAIRKLAIDELKDRQ